MSHVKVFHFGKIIFKKNSVPGLTVAENSWLFCCVAKISLKDWLEEATWYVSCKLGSCKEDWLDKLWVSENNGVMSEAWRFLHEDDNLYSWKEEKEIDKIWLPIDNLENKCDIELVKKTHHEFALGQGMGEDLLLVVRTAGCHLHQQWSCVAQEQILWCRTIGGVHKVRKAIGSFQRKSIFVSPKIVNSKPENTVRCYFYLSKGYNF